MKAFIWNNWTLYCSNSFGDFSLVHFAIDFWVSRSVGVIFRKAFGRSTVNLCKQLEKHLVIVASVSFGVALVFIWHWFIGLFLDIYWTFACLIYWAYFTVEYFPRFWPMSSDRTFEKKVIDLLLQLIYLSDLVIVGTQTCWSYFLHSVTIINPKFSLVSSKWVITKGKRLCKRNSTVMLHIVKRRL